MGRRTWRRSRRAGRRMRGAAVCRRRRRCVRASGPVQRPRLHQERDRGRHRGCGRPAGLGTRRRHVRRVGRREQVHRCGARPVQGRRVPEHDRRCPRRVPGGRVREVLPGRGRLPRHRLGDHTEPGSAFFTSILGTRAAGEPTTTQLATVKVADRGHAAGGKALPERWQRTDRWYNFADNVRGVSHVIATVDENTYVGGNTMALDTPRTNDHPSSGARTTRAAAPSTRRWATPPTASPTRSSASTSAAPSSGPPARPTRSTATAARPCSPIISRPRSRPRRTSTSRSASTSSRTAASSRPPARGQVRLHDPVKRTRS